MKTIEKYLNRHYDFRYNTILHRTFFKKLESTNAYNELDDRSLKSIWRELGNKNHNIPKFNLHALLTSDFAESYNPFIDYFENLPKWDGIDYINLLAETVHTTDNDFFKWSFKKWLVSLVACACDEDYVNQQVLILVGKQGNGKTTWINNLIPRELSRYVYSSQINPDNKDCKIAMSENILMNLDELSSYNKHQIDKFKEMISQKRMTERRVFGTSSDNDSRIVSFAGSSNEKQILIDVTGNRRFLCNEALNIDYKRKIDLELVYSQAYQLYKDNFQCYFDEVETIRIELNNENYMKSAVEIDAINEFYKIPEKDDKIEYLNATEIATDIKTRFPQFRIDINQIGKIMKAHSFQTTKVKGVQKYILAKK